MPFRSTVVRTGPSVTDDKETDSEKKRYHHGDLRQALIDAAVDIISEENIEALSLRALARRVGVSYAAPYHHFPDKSALLAVLATEGFRRLREEMERHVEESSGDPTEALMAHGRAYLHFAVSHPSYYRVMFKVNLASEKYPSLSDSSNCCFELLIRDTQTLLGDVSREDAERVGLVIWSTVHGAAQLWNDGPMKERIPGASLDDFVELVTTQAAAMLQALAETNPS